MKRLFDKYRDDLAGLFWLFLGIFIGVSLVSYSPLDPSLNSIVQNAKPHNLCGYLGSFLSDLLYQAFGVSAWVLVLGPLRQARLSFAGKMPRKEKTHWWLDILLLVCVTSLISLHLGGVRIYAEQIRLGGWVGFVFTRGLVKVLNEVGLGILLWTCFAALMIFYTDRSWSQLVQRPRASLEDFLLSAWRGLANFLSAARVVRPPALATAGGQAGTQTFFKISPEADQRKIQQVDTAAQATEEPPDLAPPDDIPAPSPDF